MAKNIEELVVALDGPAGVGKSSVAGRLATRFGLTYVETGAIYRAVAWKARETGVPMDDEDRLAAIAESMDIDFRTGKGGNRVLVDGEDRTEPLRDPQIGQLASRISALPAVRTALLEHQRAWRLRGPIIAEGRDIGTVVFPDADVKIFLTATAEERARRRQLQLQRKAIDADYDDVLAEINARDHGDSTRAVAPLKPAEDATILDCTEIDLDGVVELLSRHVEAARVKRSAAPPAEEVVGGGAPPAARGKKGYRSGFVALIGRPNTGKSTLLNHLLGTKVAIVSAKPQTTRHRILGILTRPDSQIAFVDTPGIHEAGRELNRVMVAAAMNVLPDVDVVCLLVDAIRHQKSPEREVERVASILSAIREAGRPFILVINKIDRVNKRLLLPMMEAFAEVGATSIVPVSALSGDGLDSLVTALLDALPEGEQMYPDEQVTDRGEGFMITETIREKVLSYTHQEVPHSVAITLDRIKDIEKPRRLRVITATIHVERNSQKGIIIGKQGQMLVRIGTAARLSLEARFGCRINLELHVRVERDWSRHAKGLKRVEYEP
ncbi:MAG: GTPase Era [Pseudomonadota bacterium]